MEEHRANLPIPLRGMREDVRAYGDYLRTRGSEAEMPNAWEQEGLRCARSRLRGDIKEELKTHRIRSNRLRLLRFGTKPTNSMRRRDVSNSPQSDKRTGLRYWALLQHWPAEGFRGLSVCRLASGFHRCRAVAFGQGEQY